MLGISTLGNGALLKSLELKVTAHQKIFSITSLVYLESFYSDRQLTGLPSTDFSFFRGQNKLLACICLLIEVGSQRSYPLVWAIHCECNLLFGLVYLKGKKCNLN